jgi:hypothetical protein
MKTYTKISILALFIIALTQSACTDKCTETRTFRRFNQVQLTVSQVRQNVGNESARAMRAPGKIYTKDNFIYINEIKEGVHVIDNSNPKSPKEIAFLRIPGNGDIAIKGDVMYADSYMDVIVFDVKNPTAIKEVNRLKDVYTYGTIDGTSWSIDPTRGVIFDTRAEIVTQKISTNCDDFSSSAPVFWERGGVALNDASFAGKAAAPSPGATGTGGSQARFTIYDDYLYTVSQSSLTLFDLKNPTKPVKGNDINLGWGIETIFPYKDKLFIGSTTGMFIFDNANPAKPVQMSAFSHARACDPVVADDKYAYVTLRSTNSWCGGAANQLDVIDISNLYAPNLVKTYPMLGPYGLGLDGKTLFICEGKNGLKMLDASNARDIKELQFLKGVNAYDVIPLTNSLLMVGRDGLYQYDFSNKKQLQLLSVIPVVK